jgi:hypothetical protein
LNEEGDLVNSSDEEFIQPSDEDDQGKVLKEEELTRIRMSNAHRTPTELLAKKIVNRQRNPKTKVALHRLRNIERDSINKIMNRKT